MNVGFKSQCVPRLQMLTSRQIEEFHRATLDVLWRTGVRVKHEEAVRMLQDAGCRVREGDIVHIPAWLVEECIASAPAGFSLYRRTGERAMELEGYKVNFGLGTDLLYTLDMDDGRIRPSTLEDVANGARVADHFEEIDFVASYALPREVPTNLVYIECFRTQMQNSSKPIFFTAAGAEDLAIIIEMASLVAGGEEELRRRPFLLHYAEPTSPLTHSHSAVSKLFLCADKGVPVNYTPAVLLGASGPVTLAGGIVQGNAEALSGVVLHQVRAKGAPIVSGYGVCNMDMLTSVSVYACPEYRLTLAAIADLYHYYGLPIFSTGGVSDSFGLDEQAAMEAAISLLWAAQTGANLVHDVGYLGQGLLGSPAAIVMNAEIISYVKRLLRGFDMGSEEMAVDLIHKVGPGGTYLAEAHTARWHRQEHWRPLLANRSNLEDWQRQGSRAYREQATAKAEEIISTHRPPPLPAEVDKALAEVCRRAAADLDGLHLGV